MRPILFFIHSHFQVWFSPTQVIRTGGCMAQIVSPAVQRCRPGSHLWPGIPPSLPDHIWNADRLCSHFGICESVTSSYSQLQSSWREKSQLLEALSVKKKNKTVWFQHYSWVMLFGKAFTSVSQMLAMALIGNRQCVILLFRRNVPMCWKVKGNQ